jgi:hypothetical protein
MANTLMQSLEDLKKNYGQQLTNKTAAQDMSYKAGIMPYNTAIQGADKAYQPKMNDVYSQTALSRRALAERMANMGMGAGGGTSQRATTDLSNAFLGGIKGVGLEKQGYIDTQNNAISQAAAQNQAGIANLAAENSAGYNQALDAQKQSARQQLLSMYLAKRLSTNNYNAYLKEINDFA